MPRKKTHHGQPHVQPKPAASPPVIPPGNEGTQAAGEEDDNNPEHSHASPELPRKSTNDKCWSRANVIINGILMVATVSLFFIAFFSLNTSNAYFKEIQKQFEKGNEPFLEIQPPILVTYEIGLPLVAKAIIKNLGKYPAKIIDGSIITVTRVNVPNFNEIYGPDDLKIGINRYVGENNPDTLLLYNEPNKKVLDGNYSGVINGTLFIYYFGYIIYENLITGKRVKYEFMIRAGPGDGRGHGESKYIMNQTTPM